jgi:hypothetical protein
MKYRVDFFIGDIYKVFKLDNYPENETDENYYYVFQGSLSDCEAYIRLKQNDNVEF